jgi:hypothetical protein
MEGLVPIAMAVSRMTPLASLVELCEGPHAPPFLRSSTLPRRPFLVEAPFLTVGRAGLSSHSPSLLSNLNTQASLILLSHKRVASLWAERISAWKSSRPLSLSSSANKKMEGMGAYKRAKVDYKYKQHRKERGQSI